MTVFYNVYGKYLKGKHWDIFSFLVILYMDILIFNVYRAVGITTKSNKQHLLDFCVI
jgi:hypothetical protein